MPIWTDCPPIQAASTGLDDATATALTASAVCVGSVIRRGVRITSAASTFGSLNSVSGFGQDGHGELYVVTISGSVYQIVAAP